MNSKSNRRTTQTPTPLIYEKENFPKLSREEIEKQIKIVEGYENKVRAKKLDEYKLLEEEAKFLVDLINQILQYKEQNLNEKQKEKLNEFLEFINNTDVLTLNEITSMRNYVISLNNPVDLNEEYFSESKLQTKREADDLMDYITYTLNHKKKLLSDAQQTQLQQYLEHIQKVGVKKISENEVISIQNHIRSAIYKEKKEIMSIIDHLILVYSTNAKKINILDELRKELKLLADEFLSKADSDYFTEQLKLLQTGKYIIREHLIDLVDEEFLNKIGKYPDSYIDKVNKLKTKIRRKPFILPHKYKDKIMNKLKQITRVNKFLIF